MGKLMTVTVCTKVVDIGSAAVEVVTEVLKDGKPHDSFEAVLAEGEVLRTHVEVMDEEA